MPRNTDFTLCDYVPFRQFQKMVGLRYKSAYKLAKDSNIKTFTTPSGQTLYHRRSVQAFINNNSNIKDETEDFEDKESKYRIFYCRVSSKKQENDLDRQIECAKRLYPNHTIITDTGSGINFKKKGIQTILDYAMYRNIEELVVFHKDRLCRFGFELIRSIIEKGGGRVTVIDEDTHKSSEQELAEDLLSIVHIFTCKQMGKRRYKSTTAESSISNEESNTTPYE